MNTVLVIEDNKEILENISELIELMGYKVYSATNGSEGTAIAYSTRIDLILCDIKMGNKNGYEVLLELAQNSKTKAIPFVFMTALSEPKEKNYGLELGASAYLIKPFDDEELLTVIESSIKKSVFEKFKLNLKTYLNPIEKGVRMLIPG